MSSTSGNLAPKGSSTTFFHSCNQRSCLWERLRSPSTLSSVVLITRTISEPTKCRHLISIPSITTHGRAVSGVKVRRVNFRIGIAACFQIYCCLGKPPAGNGDRHGQRISMGKLAEGLGAEMRMYTLRARKDVLDDTGSAGLGQTKGDCHWS
jgi:hypothetical protein